MAIRALCRRREPQRGALVVEAAVILPLLLFILMGFLEVGLTWRSSNRVAKTVRASVLEATVEPEDRLSDFRVIERARSTLGTGGLDDVEWLIVYRSSNVTGDIPAACLTAADGVGSGTAGVTNLCNVYSGAYLVAATPTDFVHPTCAGEVDDFLCPTERRDTFADTDRVGVALRFDHDWFTGFLPGSGQVITDSAVARLQPDPDDWVTVAP